MSYDSCLLEVAKVARRELTPTEKAGVNKTITAMMNRLDKSGKIDNLDKELLKLLDEQMQEVKTAAFIEKRNAIKNAHSRIKLEKRMMDWLDDPAEGIKSVIDSSLTSREGSKRGLARTVAAAKHNYVQGLLSRLAKKDLIKIANTNDESIQKQIWKAMHELHKDSPDMEAIGKLLPEAVEVAKEFNSMNDFARTQANKSGAWIKKLPGYVMKRSHDTLKIAKAAGQAIPLGDPRHQKAWRDWVTENLDWERSLTDVDPADREEVLNTIFTQLSNGYHVKFSNGGVPGMKGAFNIAKGLSHERLLHFKNADLEFEYHKRFGSGSNLLDNMASGLQKMARDTSIMNFAGPNAQGNLDQVVDTMVKKLTKDGEGAKAAALKKEYEYQMQKVWPNITGEASIPGSQIGARISQVSRSVMMMTDLTNAIFASITDPLAVGSVWRYTGERSGTEFFKGMSNIVKELGANVFKGKGETDLHLASEFGIGIETVSTALSILDPDHDTPGRASALVGKMFKINGMSWWQDTIRLGSAKMTAARHAMHADKVFDDLPEGMQSIFKQFNISAKEWDLIRSTEAFIDERTGDKFLLPENISKLTDDKIAPLIEGKFSAGKVDKFKEELSEKYRMLFSEIASWSTTEPGAGIRGMLLRGTRPGTAEGEMIRHLMMYKSFTASFMRNHLGRELHGYRPERLSAPAALKAMFSDPKGGSLGGISNLMFWGPILGYASLSAKDIAKGKEPRVPTDAESFRKIYMASAARSGALGLYGDFLFGEVTNKYGTDFVLGLMGPGARRAADVGNLYGTFRKGGDTGAEAFRLLLNNTPGYNLFYTRWLLDYGMVYRMQEAMNPGYLRRMERRAKKEKDQEFLIPPSSVVN